MRHSAIIQTESNSKKGSITETLFDAIVQQSKSIPDKVAIIYQDQEYTYAELYLRVEAIAEQLQCLGVQKGDKVAVLFPNHPEFVAVFFAVLGLGATVVPVNPLLKSEEIAHILHDSNAKVLIVHELLVAELSLAMKHEAADSAFAELEQIIINSANTAEFQLGLRTKNVSVQSLTQAQSASIKPHFENEIFAEKDLAMIVYTSGTTGKPKGAMLTHRNIIAAIKESIFEGFDMSSQDRFLGTLPICHIYGACVLVYFNIARGSSMVLLPKFDAKIVLATIENHRITILPMVPSMYQFLLMEMQEKSYDTSSLRICFCAASPLSRELHEEAERKLGAAIFEGYGMSETACAGTINNMQARKEGSIGKALSCIEIAIRSESGEHLPPGADNVGEIVMRGTSVMLGYYQKPQATNEAIDGEAWLLTGDLGYKDEEGFVYIVGRKKELIIRGGANIYPREVEELIMRMPEVREVAVIGVPDKLMGERVKAVVVALPGLELSEAQVKEFCSEHLANYKVPRIVEFRTELPRNATGKILKRALKD